MGAQVYPFKCSEGRGDVSALGALLPSSQAHQIQTSGWDLGQDWVWELDGTELASWRLNWPRKSRPISSFHLTIIPGLDEWVLACQTYLWEWTVSLFETHWPQISIGKKSRTMFSGTRVETNSDDTKLVSGYVLFCFYSSNHLISFPNHYIIFVNNSFIELYIIQFTYLKCSVVLNPFTKLCNNYHSQF